MPIKLIRFVILIYWIYLFLPGYIILYLLYWFPPSGRLSRITLGINRHMRKKHIFAILWSFYASICIFPIIYWLLFVWYPHIKIYIYLSYLFNFDPIFPEFNSYDNYLKYWMN